MKNDPRFNNILGEEYALFKSAIPHYDTIEEKIAESVAYLLGKKDSLMLDIGSGSGITSAFVLEKLPREVKVIAVDNEVKMISQAKEILVDHSEQVTLINADIMDYLKNTPDNYFDAVYSGWTIHNLNPQKRSNLFQEISRVTKSGGFIVNGDKIAVNDEQKHQQNYDGFVRLLKKIGPMGSPDLEREWLKHYEEDETIKFTEKEQEELLSNNGFTDIQFVIRELLDTVVIAKKV